MTTFPLSYLSDVLKVTTPTLTLQRYDEESGSGDGRLWSAELAKPLWAVSVPLRAYLSKESRAIRAKVNALEGKKHDFLFADPAYLGPADDPGGDKLGSATPTISAISEDRRTLTITGLPAGYLLSAGDRMSVAFGTDSYWFGEVRDDVTSAGVSEDVEVAVSPWVSLGVSVGDVVEIITPVLKVVVDSFTPATDQLGGYSSGASLALIQRPF